MAAPAVSADFSVVVLTFASLALAGSGAFVVQRLNAPRRPGKPLATPAFSLCAALAVLSLVGALFAARGVLEASSLQKYNPYKELGVPEGSSEGDVTKAYRKLSRTHHPDKGGDVKLFQALTRAYKVSGPADQCG
jgi:hypothetical protein